MEKLNKKLHSKNIDESEALVNSLIEKNLVSKEDGYERNYLYEQ